jgi:exopolysaccharide production protein ExoZ
MILNLQVLRGLAALAVVLYHTAFTFNGGVHTEFQGVAVFFVISGFIMTYITRDGADQFLVHRFIRIVPLYWLCTLAAIALAALKGSGRMWADASFVHIAQSLLFIPYADPSGELQPLLAVGWTLNLEMFFYVVFGAMLLVSRRLAPLLACVVLVAFKLVPERLGCTTSVCAFYAHDYTTFLILGVASFYLWRALAGAAAAARWLVLPAAAAIVALFVAWNAHPPFAAALQAWSGFPLSYAMPPLLVVAALLLHSARFECRWWPALLLGNASYALYLTHTIVIELLRHTRDRVLPNGSVLLDPAQSVLAMAVMLVVCSLAAIAVYGWIELPVLRTLRRLLIRRTSGSGAPVPAAAVVAEGGR